ncbi:MAG: CoA transferase [Caulobacteraceae bacterium]
MSAFQGIRIVDFSQGLVGPMAAMLMTDFEAETLKVEPPEGDRFKDEPGYLMWNRNKARLTLDLDTPEGLAKARDLIAASDVAIFDFSPKRLEALKLRHEDLSNTNPRLIHLWAPPYGTSGELSEMASHHATLTGLTGTAFRQGSYNDQPIWHVMPLVHYGQATVAAGAATAALIEREKSGEGQAVTVSGLHGMNEVSGPIGFIDSAGLVAGSPLGGSPGYRLYEAGDGEWFFLGCLFPHFFARCLDALGLSKVKDYPPGAIDVIGLLTDVFKQRSRDEWVDFLKAADIPAGPVGERRDWLQSGPIAANDMRLEMEHAEKGKVVMPGIALKLLETPGEVRGLMREATDEDLRRFATPRTPAPAKGGAGPAPLAGVRVLDLGTVIAGAYCSSILASYGADVVKVEPAEGDPFRPYGTGFMNYNRGKRGLGIDLKNPAGHAAFLDMARNADVVIDNYRLGVRKRLNIHYDALKAVNPNIISLSINCYGTKGPEAMLPGFDPLLQARSGMMQAQGGPGQEPVFHSVAVNDVATAAMSSFGIMAALYRREITGVGQEIETSLTAQSAMFQSGDLVSYAGRPDLKVGNMDCLGFAALDRYYPCANGWLTLACTTKAHFAALAKVLNEPQWIEEFPNPLSEPRDGKLSIEIDLCLASHTRDEIVAKLRAEGVPAAPVFRGNEANGFDWLWDNGFFELKVHPEWGELVTGRCYADFSRGKSNFDRLHPELGEHGLEVLLDYGIERDRIVELAREMVIFRG